MNTRHAAVAVSATRFESTTGAVAPARDELFELIHEHGRRVGRLTFLLCQELGASQEWSMTIARISVHHDLGKLCISSDQLLDPGPLDDTARAVVKTHTSLGEKLIRQIMSPLDPMTEIQASACRHHHERFDGSGYPDGLSGSNIPLPARILAIADVYDALTSDRPYRRAVSHADAMRQIELASGHMFDPDLVESLESLFARTGEPDATDRVVTARELTEDRWLYRVAAAAANSLKS